MSEPETAHREQRALEYAETELNIKGRIITCSKYAEQGIA